MKKLDSRLHGNDRKPLFQIKEKLASQLEQILNYVNQLNELDTKGVEPTSHAVLTENVFREDRLFPSLPVEAALQNAPQQEKGFFKVPKVIE
ncbi:MAG: Asp-tRNA(Asn)/Glu-tRNA(Gln) amidotransferase subunit GatC [Nitrospirae bacterium]|nr:Asp-tRNA(Asn)/Glu-tRNA(Gln) amidotransferase subunit GatC [Nitrospirota bacterium]